MDLKLKQRLIGALVLGALAVIFVPMIVLGPEPEGAAEAAGVPIEPPPAPGGDFVTREIPLHAAPAPAPGVVDPAGATVVAADPDALPMVDATANVAPRVDALAEPPTAVAVPAAVPPAPVATPPPAPAPEPVATPSPAPAPAPAATPPPRPAALAAGGFRVKAGTFTQRANADALVARLRSAGLSASTEPAEVDGQPATRVVLGPFADRASAEAVRVRAAAIAGSATVAAVDAAPAAAAPRPAADAAPAADPATVGFAVQLGAFARQDEAQGLVARARAAGFNAFEQRVPTANGVLWRVRLGPAVDRAAAERLQSDAAARLGIAGIIVPHP